MLSIQILIGCLYVGFHFQTHRQIKIAYQIAPNPNMSVKELKASLSPRVRFYIVGKRLFAASLVCTYFFTCTF